MGINYLKNPIIYNHMKDPDDRSFAEEAAVRLFLSSKELEVLNNEIEQGNISLGIMPFGAGRILKGASSKLFKSQNLLESHFVKHGEEMQKALGKSSYSITNYLDDANYIIQNGTYVPELNGYVRFVAGQKYGFVGLDRATGDITTFHIKTVSELIKNAPSLGLGK